MISLIGTDLYNIITQYIWINGLAAVGLTVVLCLLFKKERKKWFRRILLFGYLAFVAELTLLIREAGSRDHIDLRLFGTFGDTDYAMSFVYENILLMLPFGILVPWNVKKLQTFWRCSITGIVVSVVVETLQLLTKRGYFQLDDIWLNATGTMLGYILFWIGGSLRRKIDKE